MPLEGGVPIDRRREPLPTRVQDTTDLPDAFHQALQLGMAELELVLPDGALEVIDGHVRLLLAWTPAINLTAIRDPREVAVRHVVDSLTAARWLGDRDVAASLDLGSGGGFPGIPLAAALPGVEVMLLEPVAKKARFLATVVEATGLADRVSVRIARAEDVARDGERGRWDTVTARAVGDTAELVELAFPLLRPGGTLLAWKRGDIERELVGASRAVKALGGGTLDVIEVPVQALRGHVLISVTRAPGSVVPARYPRDPAARRRHAW